MYQTVGYDAIHLIAEAMELPLYRNTISGKALNQTSTYGDRLPNKGGAIASTSALEHDETEDLFTLLTQVKLAHPQINAVSVGAILSNYQRVRVEHVALRAGLELLPLSFLWQRDQANLLDEMCNAGMQSILIKVAGAGLEQDDLGKTLSQMRTKLHRLNGLYGAHICGEGGEYETFTLDCPLFKRKIVLDTSTIVTHGQESSDGVYYLKINRAHLEDKAEQVHLTKSAITIPDQFDRFSIRGKPEQMLKTTQKDNIDRRTASHVRQIPFSSKIGPWCAIGGIEGSASEMSDIQSEIRSAFRTLQDMLQRQGLSLEDLAHINVYLSSQRYFVDLNAVYTTLFGVDPPSRACVATNLDESQTNILIDAYAYNGSSSKNSISSARKALHVQGRSYWAAANIGPYSQAVEVGGRISIAGQIGLNPITLQLVPDSSEQTVLALQHARRIFKAILEDHRIAQRKAYIEGCICWLNNVDHVPFAHQLWLNQSQANVHQDDEDENLSSHDWENEWLGTNLGAEKIPILFVILAKDGLPRHASVEWQLSGQSGDQECDEDFDEEKDNANVPKETNGIDQFGQFRMEFACISKKSSNTTQFGIAYLSIDDEQKAPENKMIKSILANKAAHLRFFYTHDGVIEQLRKSIEQLHIEPLINVAFVPVSRLFDRKANEIDAAIVWQTM